MKTIWTNLIYTPIFKVFLFLASIFPGGSVGFAIIAITVAVKIALLPLSIRASKNAILLRKIQPKIDAVKIKFKDQKAQAVEIMRVYKEEGVHPMSGCLPTLIQIPVLIALYRVMEQFFKGQAPQGLFIPEYLNTMFFGLDLSGKSIILAILVGLAQFFMAKIMPTQNATGEDFQAQMARSMQMQMKYVLPVMMAFLAYATNGALSLYLLISISLSIVQEILVKKYYANKL